MLWILRKLESLQQYNSYKGINSIKGALCSFNQKRETLSD